MSCQDANLSDFLLAQPFVFLDETDTSRKYSWKGQKQTSETASDTQSSSK
jgi:hypothetical protein